MGDFENLNWFTLSQSHPGKSARKEHPDYAQSLYNLADLYINMNNYKKQNCFTFESKAIREKCWGKNIPAIRTVWNALAYLYEKQSNFSAAESLLTAAAALEQARISGQLLSFRTRVCHVCKQVPKPTGKAGNNLLCMVCCF